MSKTIKRNGIIVVLLVAFQLLALESKAQLNPLGGVYFQNQYISNPAVAGLDTGLTLAMGYRQQWSSIQGAPATKSLTGTYGLTDRVGLGLNIYNDEAGLLRRTKVMGTYAYHMQVGAEEEKLSFGLSLGFMNERVGYEDMKGDQADPNVSRFNQRETFIDGDFGVAYTSNRLAVQGAIPNMKTFFKKDDNANSVDHSLFFTAVSYKFYFPQALNGLGIEPKAVYRGVRGHDNIADLGANFTFANNAASMMAMYHSSQSATFGMGLRYASLSMLAMYTTETAALSGYTKGNFEIGLSYNWR
jgi:type IX secretion system PorP/SprF family membrane protein